MFFRSLFGGNDNLSPSEAKQLLAVGALLVDVRTPGEFSTGHVRGSRNIPLDQLPRHYDTLRKSGKPVIFVCASGGRAGRAAAMAKQNGIEAYNAGSWVNLR